jgi:cytochrome c
MYITVLVAALFLSTAASSFVHAAGDATRGEQLYESRCMACHSLDANRVGPMHRGVYGRKAGSVPDFAYSVALSSSPIVWSDTTLNRWLTDPEALIPGQRMNIRVLSADDRADLIAFLRRESGK